MASRGEYDPTATHLSERNYKEVKKYWEKYPKDQHKSLARPYYGSRGGRIEDKINSVEDTMYTERSKERIQNMKQIIQVLFFGDIQFVYDYRSAIRIDPNTSLTSCELFRWMKEKDENLYNAFKIAISTNLNEAKSEPEAKVKDKIVKLISYVLGNYFIRL